MIKSKEWLKRTGMKKNTNIIVEILNRCLLCMNQRVLYTKKIKKIEGLYPFIDVKEWNNEKNVDIFF